MIDLNLDKESLARSVAHLKARGVILPTFEQMAHPERIPQSITSRLGQVGLWEMDPLNLFRITWKNEPLSHGGGFGPVNRLELPSSLTGVNARIIGLVGKWFPTGAHKVGATYACLVPKLVTGQFDPLRHKAAWPSTGNFCRGGAYNATIIGCESIAILPEEMSRERFDWLKTVAGEIIPTPGCESNVKEIYDKCAELRADREDVIVFNQFQEFGNYLWHYHVTGQAMNEVLAESLAEGQRLAGVVASTGSAGTIACADFLKNDHPLAKTAVMEPTQCPTLALNGFGGHRIEGIGDKHVPWIHNLRQTDLIIGLDDEAPMQLLRLFNEPAGKDYLAQVGVPQETIEALDLLGISGVGNLLAAIKFARFFELGERDVVLTVLTDSMELFMDRLAELTEAHGPYGREEAVVGYAHFLKGVATDHVYELGHYDRKRIHNLKYYTWIEQLGQDVSELVAQWDDYPDYWEAIRGQVGEIDRLIGDFNRRTGLGL